MRLTSIFRIAAIHGNWIPAIPAGMTVLLSWFYLLAPHLGRDCRDPSFRDDCIAGFDVGSSVLRYSHPWKLDPGNPCRNDGIVELVLTLGSSSRQGLP